MKKHKNFLALAKSRKQTYEFSNKAVSKSKINQILEASRWAPSCGNSQPWHFLIITKKEKITSLMENTFYTHYPFIHPAPPIIIIFILKSDCVKKERTCTDVGERKVSDGYLSVAMAVQNALLAAEELGISSCILTPREKKDRALKIKNGDEVILYIGLGYEKKNAFKKERYREKLENLRSYEQYGGKR